MGDLMGDLRNPTRPPSPPGSGGPGPTYPPPVSGGPGPTYPPRPQPQDPIRQPLPPSMTPGFSTGQGIGPIPPQDPIRQPLPPVGDSTGRNGFPGQMPPEMAPPNFATAPMPGNSTGQGMNFQPPPIRQPLPPQAGGPGREFSGGPNLSPGAPKMTDQTNNARSISAPRIPPMRGGTPGWYGKNAPQGGSFTPPPSAGLMAGQDTMNRKKKVTPFA